MNIGDLDTPRRYCVYMKICQYDIKEYRIIHYCYVNILTKRVRLTTVSDST